MLTCNGTWIPLVEYAIKTKVSLSTLRRHIKANKLPHKVHQGKYLLWYDPSEATDPMTQLQIRLLKAQEEIAELKTLIAYYEENHLCSD